MSNSPLVSYTRISPNHNSPRKFPITRITPHCVVGQFTAKQILDMNHFTTYDPDNGSSCNYAVGKDGSIGQGVDEGDRSWCSSSFDNDHRAVTIEVSSELVHPYEITDAAYKALIDLMVDVCKRNRKFRLVWPGSKDAALAYRPKADEMVLTAHRFFANKACPGDYMYTRFGQMAEEVTARLEDDDDMTQEQFKQMMAAYEASKANPVPDNDPADWEKEGVEWAVQNGLMAGDGTGNLKLHDNITRGQFCVMLKRYHDQMKG